MEKNNLKPKFKRNRLCSGVHYEESKRAHIQYVQELHEKNKGYILNLIVVHKELSPLEQFEMSLRIQIENYKKSRK